MIPKYGGRGVIYPICLYFYALGGSGGGGFVYTVAVHAVVNGLGFFFPPIFKLPFILITPSLSHTGRFSSFAVFWVYVGDGGGVQREIPTFLDNLTQSIC